MRYWGILAAKLVAGGALLYGIWLGLWTLYEPPDYLVRYNKAPFGHDLSWTTLMFFFNLLCSAVLVAILLDQKYRCRKCGRRLRMPVRSGSHAQFLFRPPKTEYICAYGHGTLNVPDLKATGGDHPAWKKHDDDIWKELFPEKQER